MAKTIHIQDGGTELRYWELCRGSTDCKVDKGEGATELLSPQGKDTEVAREVALSQGEKTPASGFKTDNRTAAGRNVGASGLSTVQMAAWRGRLEAHLSTKGHT